MFCLRLRTNYVRTCDLVWPSYICDVAVPCAFARHRDFGEDVLEALAAMNAEQCLRESFSGLFA